MLVAKPRRMSRRFFIRTYGCQMNVHDSEKVANLLHHAGFEAAPKSRDADLLLINTCSIRDKAEHRLYSDLGALRRVGSRRGPERVIGRRRLRGPAGRRRAARDSRSTRLRLRHPQPAARPRDGRSLPAGRAIGDYRVDGDPLPRAFRACPSAIPIFAADHAGPGLPHGDGRLRHVLQLLHRARGPGAARSAGPRTASWTEARDARTARGVRRAHAARPDRQRLRAPRSCGGRPTPSWPGRWRSASCSRSLAADPGHRAPALYEPAPAVLRRGARCARTPRFPRSSAPTSTCRLQSRLGPHRWRACRRRYTAATSTLTIARRLRPRATRHRDHDGSDRGLPGRDRGRLRGRR